MVCFIYQQKSDKIIHILQMYNFVHTNARICAIIKLLIKHKLDVEQFMLIHYNVSIESVAKLIEIVLLSKIFQN